MINYLRVVFVFIIVSLFIQSCRGKIVKEKADLVLINGIVATVEESNPAAEAIAVKEGKIFAIGSTNEIKNYIGESTQIIDLKGKFIMPGFIESHAHFLGLGNSRQILDLRNAKNWDEVIEIVAEAAEKAQPGEWIIGRGWHQEKFSPEPNPNVNGYPIHNELSKASPENPVILFHASGHAIFANAKAMKNAGINRNTANPTGGTIVRDSSGNPIGVFEENAEQLVKKYYDEYLAKRTPGQIRADFIKQIQLASEECLKNGVTSFHDAGETFEIIDLMKELADSNKIPIRLNAMIGESLSNIKKKLLENSVSGKPTKNYFLIGYGKNFLTVRSIKQYIDGALGSRGAWMLEPYNDLPNHYGSNVTSIDELKETSLLALKNGFQMNIHAIGDRGNREVLNLYESIFKKHPGEWESSEGVHSDIPTGKNLRWRIEHAQHISAQDIPRFAELGVIAAMQGVHSTSDAAFVTERLGDKRAEEGAYAWKKLIKSGTTICNGTDAPVEDIDPIKSFYSSVTRKLPDGSEFYPLQKMSRLEALKSYTINGAYASFEEKIKGSIKVGKLADLVVLSNDLLNCSDDDILKTRVLYTIVGGKVLYKAN
ncbi:MAG: amidohydrolase [Bacteroidota bacterium]